ncbi:SDR family NAD(P)-dependent oxidoreductase [Streptomyces sp. MA5143a]|uniref:SDR family NAD(P)-dependent oxidoreductase n=1 Tax=Streptomyces sp. MA5143a TaxID=2083010 RepID=UPI000D1B07E7|nr:SDR family oxidoreductase [Streptomyces sp. MA5143a]
MWPAARWPAVNVFGHLDDLVCNAGIDIIKPAVEYTPEEWDRILTETLRGAFQPAQAAARHWMAQGSGGSVTMTSSIAGAVGIPTLAPYAAGKGGSLACRRLRHRIHPGRRRRLHRNLTCDIP